MKMRIKGTNESFELLEESRAGLGKVLFKGKVMEIPLGQINLIAEPCQDEDKLVILPGVGLVAKGSIMAEYTPLTVGNLYKPPKKESA